jgi:two-component sensor histidine kinase
LYIVTLLADKIITKGKLVLNVVKNIFEKSISQYSQVTEKSPYVSFLAVKTMLMFLNEIYVNAAKFTFLSRTQGL